MVTEIKLTRGFVAVVDDVDSDLAKFRWTTYTAGYGVRAILIDGKPRRIVLHRLILERKLGRDLLDSEFADHRDNNPENCRRSNLRLANRVQNASNRRLNKNSISGYKGVGFDKYMKARPWIAKINVQGVVKNLGRFDNALDAHRAYAIAALTYHKDFANLGDTSPFTGMTLADFDRPIIQLALPLKGAA
jgi:hypothetical protein